MGDEHVDFPTTWQRKWKRNKGNQKTILTAPEDGYFVLSLIYLSVNQAFPKQDYADYSFM